AMSLDTPIVVLDFETTGLNTKSDRIIEIGAVKLYQHTIIDSYSTLVNPNMSLPPIITKITGITDMMLVDQPSITQTIPQLLAFIGDSPIAAHNAAFDVAMLKSELKRQNLTLDVPQIDTLSFSRKLYPQLRSYKLKSLCKHLGVSLVGAHRAVNDATATAQCLDKMLEEAASKGACDLLEIDQLVQGGAIGQRNHAILLATSQKGLENLNHLVSISHLEYFQKLPHMPKPIVQKFREGLLIGSACEAGELYQAVLKGASDSTLRKIARFYDYLEIQPLANNAFLLRNGQADSEEELREMNRKIVALGDTLGIPVVATGDVHFLDPQDAVCRAILQTGLGYHDSDEQPPLYFKTTEEMLEEFAYLGEEKAKEVVITNPQKIANRVEELTLFPKHPKGEDTFQPLWEDAAKNIETMSLTTAKTLYGSQLPEVVTARLDKELKSIIGYGFATLYMIAHMLVKKSLDDGYLVGSRGSVGSSFVATMCGITEVNPLPPHYRCAHCQTSDFDVDKQTYKVGVDLPDKLCPNCANPLIKDGFDIPFEVFLGFKGDKVPDIDLNFSGVYQPRAHAYVEDLFGKGHVFRAGTISALADKTAFGFVSKYLEEKGLIVGNAEKQRLVNGCVGVKRTTGQHPGGMVVVPQEYEVYQFTAIQHPADDKQSGTITTHYDFNSMHDILVKLDILGHDDPTMIHMLSRLTGVSYKNIQLDDPKVMSLFQSPEALGVTSEEINCSTGTYGVPEFGTGFVRQMLEDTKPSTMEELIRISGLSHGTDVWLGNARDLITSGTAPLSQCICTRDDIMNALITYGVESKMSFDIMENVRKGKGLTIQMEEAMTEKKVPGWFIESCQKIKYMFPKGHAVAYVTMALRIAWFKVYHPLSYYAAYFTVRGDGFDSSKMLLSADVVQSMLNDFDAAQQEGKNNFKEKMTAKEKDEATALEIVLEMLRRGFDFLPVDLYRSDVNEFLIEGNKLRVPFTSVGGLGITVAQAIAKEREKPFLSIEDLKNRTKMSTTVIDTLKEQGCLQGLSDTSQVDLFSFL
ncbi:MAG: PolC-type DNA polymerase III, partial [Clostridiales bacterium]|nr:PolC-type DNA polymerase III [Clostridiales bacterium]